MAPRPVWHLLAAALAHCPPRLDKTEFLITDYQQSRIEKSRTFVQFD
ncbi:hypothetical protein RTCIAT899_CH15710 [Rhizobium tropici CIAT 899]|nr:hypothetical protein RTCIAT899_CH15710 [Rhizobium tropici CIAT 899]